MPLVDSNEEAAPLLNEGAIQARFSNEPQNDETSASIQTWVLIIVITTLVLMNLPGMLVNSPNTCKKLIHV